MVKIVGNSVELNNNFQYGNFFYNLTETGKNFLCTVRIYFAKMLSLRNTDLYKTNDFFVFDVKYYVKTMLEKKSLSKNSFKTSLKCL